MDGRFQDADIEDESIELSKKGIVQEKVLGEGSYSHVKAALWKKCGDSTGTSMKVALKIINRATAPVEFKKKFLPRELKILNNLKHPNIIQMYESFNIRNKTYICLEYAGHGDLLEFVQLKGALDQDETKKLFKEMCAGISYLHGNGVVHRDLKCENILLAANNEIKIADFGFAREIDKTELSKTFCGSAAYAAPEVIKGIPYEGKSVDIWSLGVILFIMACCVMPFRDHSRGALLHDQEMPLNFPPKVSSKLPPSFKHLTNAILNFCTEERFKLMDILNHAWMHDMDSCSISSIGSKPKKEISSDSGFESVTSWHTCQTSIESKTSR